MLFYSATYNLAFILGSLSKREAKTGSQTSLSVFGVYCMVYFWVVVEFGKLSGRLLSFSCSYSQYTALIVFFFFLSPISFFLIYKLHFKIARKCGRLHSWREL